MKALVGTFNKEKALVGTFSDPVTVKVLVVAQNAHTFMAFSGH